VKNSNPLSTAELWLPPEPQRKRHATERGLQFQYKNKTKLLRKAVSIIKQSDRAYLKIKGDIYTLTVMSPYGLFLSF
jgi:Holliday junction resolvase RusA-like endonuclease